ncbi:hypothetical protein GGR60_001735 [Xanthomonas arboricola]|nr:hypothetical protein [Xanthomonas euroxanthea]NIK08988.1 hypothetical protein [Xanthomonas euroxanthea]NIK40806.1 hypothetical protein [Xanthomonas euroxanthea]NJC37200.1 hypothetical protein [Xanthomonas euroxanthea]
MSDRRACPASDRATFLTEHRLTGPTAPSPIRSHVWHGAASVQGTACVAAGDGAQAVCPGGGADDRPRRCASVPEANPQAIRSRHTDAGMTVVT